MSLKKILAALLFAPLTSSALDAEEEEKWDVNRLPGEARSIDINICARQCRSNINLSKLGMEVES